MSINVPYSVLPKPLKRKRIALSHAITVSDSKSRTPWHRRLWWTGIDRKARDAIVALDNELGGLLAAAGDEFVDYLFEKHQERGYITGQDIERALGATMDEVIDLGSDIFLQRNRDMSLRATEQALEKAGVTPVVAATNRLMRFATLRVEAQDDAEGRIRQNYQDSMSRIRSLPVSVIENLRTKLMDAQLIGASTRDVIRAVIGDLIDDLDPTATRDAIREIWEKTRTNLERVVRTESINNYAKVQLEEWASQGVREVTRHSINDEKTCAKCRALSRPGHNVYDIQELLKLEHPVTEDPANPGQFLTHPNCRCWFRPVLGDIWGELEGLERELFQDVEGKSVQVTDVPLDSQETVNEVVKDWNKNATEIGADFGFVQNITGEPNWQTNRLEELMREDPETADARLEAEIVAGEVVEWTDPDTDVTFISDAAADVNYISLPFTRRQGEIRWDSDAGLRKWWTRRYNEKMAETGMTLEENGVQIFGGLPFFVEAAGQSPRDYFVEAYAHYIADPVLLAALDAPAYNRLKTSIFAGVEYLERGGVH